MSRRAYLSFADVEGKLDTLRVECTKWPGGGDPVGWLGGRSMDAGPLSIFKYDPVYVVPKVH